MSGRNDMAKGFGSKFKGEHVLIDPQPLICRLTFRIARSLRFRASLSGPVLSMRLELFDPLFHLKFE
jgi:hypothetical protein